MRWNRLIVALALAALMAAGCSRTPEQKLRGRWEAAPDFSGAIDRAVAEREGKPLPPLRKSDDIDVATGVSWLFSRMEVNLRSDGTASYKQRTGILGLDGRNHKGTWQLVSSDSDLWVVRMGTAEHRAEGKLLWDGTDAFYFRFEHNGDAEPRRPGAEPSFRTLKFRRP
jgi:hypothetical protein